MSSYFSDEYCSCDIDPYLARCDCSDPRYNPTSWVETIPRRFRKKKDLCYIEEDERNADPHSIKQQRCKCEDPTRYREGIPPRCDVADSKKMRKHSEEKRKSKKRGSKAEKRKSKVEKYLKEIRSAESKPEIKTSKAVCTIDVVEKSTAGSIETNIDKAQKVVEEEERELDEGNLARDSVFCKPDESCCEVIGTKTDKRTSHEKNRRSSSCHGKESKSEHEIRKSKRRSILKERGKPSIKTLSGQFPCPCVTHGQLGEEGTIDRMLELQFQKWLDQNMSKKIEETLKETMMEKAAESLPEESVVAVIQQTSSLPPRRDPEIHKTFGVSDSQDSITIRTSMTDSDESEESYGIASGALSSRKYRCQSYNLSQSYSTHRFSRKRASAATSSSISYSGPSGFYGDLSTIISEDEKCDSRRCICRNFEKRSAVDHTIPRAHLEIHRNLRAAKSQVSIAVTMSMIDSRESEESYSVMSGALCSMVSQSQSCDLSPSNSTRRVSKASPETPLALSHSTAGGCHSELAIISPKDEECETRRASYDYSGKRDTPRDVACGCICNYYECDCCACSSFLDFESPPSTRPIRQQYTQTDEEIRGCCKCCRCPHLDRKHIRNNDSPLKDRDDAEQSRKLKMSMQPSPSNQQLPGSGKISKYIAADLQKLNRDRKRSTASHELKTNNGKPFAHKSNSTQYVPGVPHRACDNTTSTNSFLQHLFGKNYDAVKRKYAEYNGRASIFLNEYISDSALHYKPFSLNASRFLPPIPNRPNQTQPNTSESTLDDLMSEESVASAPLKESSIDTFRGKSSRCNVEDQMADNFFSNNKYFLRDLSNIEHCFPRETNESDSSTSAESEPLAGRTGREKPRK